MKKRFKRLTLLFLVVLMGLKANAQVMLVSKNQFESSECIRFDLSVNNKLINLHKPVVFQNDTITFNEVKIYLSNITVLDSNFQMIYFDKTPYIIDFDKFNSLFINKDLLKRAFQINFKIGTDTILRSMPPMKGELSASNGMYWNWSSGFMSLKMEGTHTISDEPNHIISFHLGGPSFPIFSEFIWNDLSKHELAFELSELLNNHSFKAFPVLMENNETSGFVLQYFREGFYER